MIRMAIGDELACGYQSGKLKGEWTFITAKVFYFRTLGWFKKGLPCWVT